MSSDTQIVLPCIEINPIVGSAKKSIIWLHGLGADGNDFVPIVQELRLPSATPVRFVFPHAPIIPITINNGVKMRAWFDVTNLTFSGNIDQTGITRSIRQVEELISQEIARGISSNNIILAGFSQGAIIALITGLTYTKPLAGIIALSGCLPHANALLKQASPTNQHLPIFIGHGADDVVVPYNLGHATYLALKEANYPVTWHSYAMAHSVCAEEIDDIREWIMDLG